MTDNWTDSLVHGFFFSSFTIFAVIEIIDICSMQSRFSHLLNAAFFVRGLWYHQVSGSKTSSTEKHKLAIYSLQLMMTLPVVK